MKNTIMRVLIIFIVSMICLTYCGCKDSSKSTMSLSNTKWEIDDGTKMIYHFNQDASEFLDSNSIPVYKKKNGKYYLISFKENKEIRYYLDADVNIKCEEKTLEITIKMGDEIKVVCYHLVD